MTIPALSSLLALSASLWTSSPQEAAAPAPTVIRLQRTLCLGTCPVYTVTIDGRGVVTFEGDQFVRVAGRRTAQIDPSVVTRLMRWAEAIGFFDLRDEYLSITNPDGSETMVTDLPTTIVMITVNGRTKRVEDYVGAPDSLADFEREIDEVAGTKRWIFVDEPTLDELLRSGWLASSEEGASLLQEAIDRDEVAIARRLIEMGADPNGPPDHRVSPLLSARSGAMVDLLVKAGADPNEGLVGGEPGQPPLIAAAWKDAGVAEALVKAGARLEEQDEEGQTALWYAACQGNWRVVKVLLALGASPRGASVMTAADCARNARQNEVGRRRTVLDRDQSTVEDFDRVIALLEAAPSPATKPR